MNRRIPLAPAEGWLTVGLTVLLCLTMAWSIDDVALVLGEGRFTDFLAPVAVLGVAFGFIGPKVGWGRWWTYLIGSIFAALIVPLIVGLQLVPTGATLAEAYQETARSVVQAVIDLVVLDLALTNEYGHYMLFLGLLVWATAMFASYAIFGHRRPLNAIVIVGLVLLVNMSLTLDDQLVYLVMFSLSSLFLLVRFHVLEEQTDWLRRRIGDPASISGIYLRGGTMFIAVAVIGSLFLTNVARSAPLQGSWSGMSSGLVELSRSIQRFLPTGGNTRPFGSDFDPTSTSIRGKWQPNDELVATIKLAVDEKREFYWRAATFDQFTGNGWVTSKALQDKTAHDAGDPLLDGTAEAPGDATGIAPLTFTVTPASGSGSILLSPLTPATVDVPTDVTLLGPDGYLGAIERHGNAPYTVVADVRLKGNDPGELNQSALRAAGQDYPPDIARLYGASTVPANTMRKGGYADRLLQQLVAEAPDASDPFAFASYLSERFREPKATGGLFDYQTDILDLMANECKDLSTVECFAEFRRGYCQHYATTMAIFLRARGIPARIVEGYLPSARTAQGEEKISGTSRHEWVEVYFPGYGWYTFDPTGGNRSKEVALPSGPPQGSARPVASSAFLPPRPTFDRQEPNGDPSGVASRRTNIAIFAAFAILLALVVGGLAFIAWQRGPRSGTTADRAYRTVTRLASRFGFGPRPSQTVYEYSGILSEVLPIMRPELETVAQAKVETAYARGHLSDERLRALRQAERRLRLNLLRLAFRRGERRRR
jgi:hypothetical protein